MVTVRIQAKVSPAVHDGLKRAAKDEGRTLSSMIAYVLRMYVDRAEGIICNRSLPETPLRRGIRT